MKNFITKSVLPALCALSAIAAAPSAKATNVTVDGSARVTFGGAVNYYEQGIKQGGRYKNLGADNYRKATFNVDYVTNRSKKTSGALSIELWAMPYKGATSGLILMTKGLEPMEGKQVYRKVLGYGYAIYLNRKRVPEFNLWEYTGKGKGKGWKFRDALTMPTKRKL